MDSDALKENTIKIKRLTDTAIIPTRATDGAAGYDLYVDTDTSIVISPHKTRMLQTNIAFEIPVGWFGAVFARSGLSTRHGIRPSTCVSVIDSDYRGSVGVPLHNDFDSAYMVRRGERVAQIVFLPAGQFDLVEVDDLTDTDRGNGGFGSTG